MATNNPLTNNNLLALENQVCFPLYAASRLVIRQYQPLLEKVGLTYPQYIAMMILWEHRECTVKEIGEKMLLNTNTLTPLLKRLEEQGLLYRYRSEEDERVVLISLTEAGKALKKPCQDIPLQLIQAIQYPLPKALKLKQLLDELVETLKEP